MLLKKTLSDNPCVYFVIHFNLQIYWNLCDVSLQNFILCCFFHGPPLPPPLHSSPIPFCIIFLLLSQILLIDLKFLILFFIIY